MPDNEKAILHLTALPVEPETKDVFQRWKEDGRRTNADLIQQLVIHAAKTNFDPVKADVDWKEGD